MESGNKHGPRVDDELEAEVDQTLKSGKPTHVDEGRQPTPPADDDPDVRPWHPNSPEGVDEEQDEP